MSNTLFPLSKTHYAKPFLKWAGGKTQLIPSIHGALPKMVFQNKELVFIEPFVGGGAIVFWMLKTFPNISKAVINDINPDLINAYKVIKEHPGELISSLSIIQSEYRKLSIEEDKRLFFIDKRNLFNTKSLNCIDNATLMIFLNRTCFNGLYRVNSKGLFNVPFGKYLNPTICDEQTIIADSEALQKVEIFNGDFTDTAQFASSKSFFYLDPPYKPLNQTSNFNSYSKEFFGDKDQVRLKMFVDEMHYKGSFLLVSNSDVKSVDSSNQFFDDLYSSYIIERVFANRMINSNSDSRGKIKELLISNYNYENSIQDLRFSR